MFMSDKDYDILDKRKREKFMWDDGKACPDWMIIKNLSTFTRDDKTGVDAKPPDILWDYFIYLCKLVGLNGPDKEQTYRTKETDDKTYFTLALKMFNLRYKVKVERDNNRVSDARRLRETYALTASRYKDYSSIDKVGASMLEVIIAMVERFDTNVMMTDSEEDRSSEWFWLMMKNASLDIFVDAGFTEDDNNCNQMCDSILYLINNREYAKDGQGGFFPLKNPKCNQKDRELWLQMHDYFVENRIE